MLPTVIRRPRTAQDIATGVRLARMHGKEITPSAVARVLRLAKVRYVLVGAHAANGYPGRPRTTIDVDEGLLQELGELVDPGGGDEIGKLYADAGAGRRLEF